MEGCRHGKTRSRRAGTAASPRTIAQRANTSTGSIYTRFGCKEELFDALAKEHAYTVMSRFMQAQNGFAQPPPPSRPRIWTISPANAWTGLPAARMRSGCRYAARKARATNILCMNMLEIVAAYAHRFLDALHSLGRNVRSAGSQREHIVVSGMFAAFLEVIIHD